MDVLMASFMPTNSTVGDGTHLWSGDVIFEILFSKIVGLKVYAPMTDFRSLTMEGQPQ